MESKRTQARIDYMESIGWEYMPLDDMGWEYMKFNRAGIKTARQGDRFWNKDISDYLSLQLES